MSKVRQVLRRLSPMVRALAERIGVMPTGETPPRSILLRLILAFVLASGLWVGVTSAQDPVRVVKYDDVPVTAQYPPQYYPVQRLPTVTVTAQGLSSALPDSVRPTGFVDLTHVAPGSAQPVPVQVRGLPRTVEVSVDPRMVQVPLETKVTRRGIPVYAVGFGLAPSGYLDTQFASVPPTITITGPSRVVNSVVFAHVSVNVATFTQSASLEVTPQLFDHNGVGVGQGIVQIEPHQVTVTVTVRRQPYQQLVPVQASIKGVVAPGYAIASVAVFPQLVQALSSSQLTAVRLTTAPIVVTGWTASRTLSVPLLAPPGVSLTRMQATVTIGIVPVPGSATTLAQLLVVGKRPGTTVALGSPSVTVAYQGPLVALKKARAPLAVLDLGNRPPGVYRLRPGIMLPPGQGLSLLAVTPPLVRVIITAPPRPRPHVAGPATPPTPIARATPRSGRYGGI